MNRYESLATTDAVVSFMTKVYAWMGFALLLTALTAHLVASSESVISFIFGNRIIFYGLLIGQLALVIAISAAINKISSQMASLLFVIYSLLTGVTFSFIFMIYAQESIATTFFVTAGVFVLMSIYGTVTKQDLTKLGNILFMALLGLILATVVNFFWANSTLYWITTYVGVLIFVGLVAYDTQMLRKLGAQVEEGESAAKFSIIGALRLYLDFINMFLFLLRIFGRRR